MNDEIITSYLLGKKAGGGTPPVYQDKEVSITQNGETTITKDEGYDALSSVELTVAVPQPSGKISITQNGTDIDVSSYASADVNVPAGADLSEYFESSIGSDSSGTTYNTPWVKAVKKLPSFTASGNSLQSAFKFFQGTEPPEITNLSSVIKFSGCYEHCKGFINLDLSNWQFGGNVNDISSMFQYCSNLEEIDMSSLGITANNTYINNMFFNCSKLKKVNLSNFAPTSIGSSGYMFSGCGFLEELDISSMNFSNIGQWTSGMFSGVPDNCLILVKDQTAVDWFTTNWPNLTNVQIKS